MKQCVIGFKGNDLFINGPVEPFLIDLEHIADTRLGISRFKPSDFPIIKNRLVEQGWEIVEEFNTDYIIGIEDQKSISFSNLRLYTHQKRAYDSWKRVDCKGVVILPTGSGKSYIAFEAISELLVKTLIVVPTIFLLNQWKEKLMEFDIGEELIGTFGGGKKELKPITVITYDSASIYTRRLRDVFGLIVFDEVHHLAKAETYQNFAKGCIAPYRLGLTATLNEGEDIEEFSGPVVIKLLPSELRKTGIIADYIIKTIEVELDPDSRKKYKNLLKTYRSYINTHKLYKKGNPIQQMVLRSGRDEQARKALKSFRESRKIYQNASMKIKALVEIFESHPDEQILIFSESIPFIEKISRELFLPHITHKTNNVFRKRILQAFKRGKFRILASGRIFDEGLDMHDLSVGIIVSGTSQQRQLVQRLGRVLRKSEKKDKAVLYEIITKDTVEERHSAKRKRGV